MDSGLYAAYTGLMARTQALDTASNNLANAGTNGFRAQRDYFRGVLVDSLRPGSPADSQVGRTVNEFGILGGNALDMGQGQLVTTGNPLDLAIQGLIAQALEGSDVRTEKVAALQESIANGSYNVSSSDVADKMIRSLLG